MSGAFTAQRLFREGFIVNPRFGHNPAVDGSHLIAEDLHRSSLKSVPSGTHEISVARLPDDLDPAAWHRHFAMEANNRAWELSTEPRDAARDQEMLDAAHASAWRWAVVGTELNRMRAKMLLAEVHALLGYGATAIVYAREMRDYFLNKADTPHWEVAFTHAVYAHAAHAAGDAALHRNAYEEAIAAVAAIADEEDRAIVQKTLRNIPTP